MAFVSRGHPCSAATAPHQVRHQDRVSGLTASGTNLPLSERSEVGVLVRELGGREEHILEIPEEQTLTARAVR